MKASATRKTTKAGQTPQAKRPDGVFRLFASAIVPGYTFLFACQGNLITSNLSQIGNLPGRRAGFILWGALCAVFFYTYFTRLFMLADYTSRAGKGLLHAACLSFVLCVLLPFLPEKYPVSARLHNDLAMGAAVLTAVLVCMVTLHLHRVELGLFIKSSLLWTLVITLCLFLMRTTGISGLLEAVFVIAACIYLSFVMERLYGLQQPEEKAPEVNPPAYQPEG